MLRPPRADKGRVGPGGLSFATRLASNAMLSRHPEVPALAALARPERASKDDRDA